MRATNEALLKQDNNNAVDEKIEGSIESEIDQKDTVNEPAVVTAARLRKKSQNVLNRSDSTGSTSGRKYLAPTLSDPQARNDKDRYGSSKKKPTGRTATGAVKTNLAHFTELAHHLSHHNHHHHLHHHHHNEQQATAKVLTSTSQVTMVYEVHDWWSEQVLCIQTSDDESCK